MSDHAVFRGAAAEDNMGTDRQAFERLRVRELLVRFAFGAAISATAGFVGLLAGRTAGGLFLAFPAILPAAITLVESKEGTSKAISEMRGAVLGALAMAGFAGIVLALVARIPPCSHCSLRPWHRWWCPAKPIVPVSHLIIVSVSSSV